MANAKPRLGWTSNTAQLLPVRPYRLSYNFLNGLIESDTPPVSSKAKALLLRSVKNARLVETAERLTQQDFQVYQNLQTLSLRGKLKTEVDLTSYFDGSSSKDDHGGGNLLKPYLSPEILKRDEPQKKTRRASMHPLKTQRYKFGCLLQRKQSKKGPAMPKIDLSRYLKKPVAQSRLSLSPMDSPLLADQLLLQLERTPLSDGSKMPSASASVSEQDEDEEEETNDTKLPSIAHQPSSVRGKSHREQLIDITRAAQSALETCPSNFSDQKVKRPRREVILPTRNKISLSPPPSLTHQMLSLLQSPARGRGSAQRVIESSGRGCSVATAGESGRLKKKKEKAPSYKYSGLGWEGYELIKKRERLRAAFLKAKFKQRTIAKFLQCQQLGR